MLVISNFFNSFIAAITACEVSKFKTKIHPKTIFLTNLRSYSRIQVKLSVRPMVEPWIMTIPNPISKSKPTRQSVIEFFQICFNPSKSYRYSFVNSESGHRLTPSFHSDDIWETIERGTVSDSMERNGMWTSHKNSKIWLAETEAVRMSLQVKLGLKRCLPLVARSD